VTDHSYRRSAEVLWRNVGPEVLITRQVDTTMDVLSPAASAVWRLLGRPKSADEIADQLNGSEGQAEEISTGVETMLRELLRRGYIERGDG
jgi:hypothetical protein